MLGAGKGAVGNAVAIHVAVALKFPDPLQVRGRKHLAARNRFVGVFERVGHPVVHPEIEIAHQEDRSLKLLGEIECLHRHGVALLDRGGQQQDVHGVAMRQVDGG